MQCNTIQLFHIQYRKENTGKIISFLNETGLGCIAMSKSPVQLELTWTGLSVHGIMKMYLKYASVMIYVCMHLSWALTQHLHAWSTWHAVTAQQVGIRTTDAKLKANWKMPQITCKGHIPFSLGLNKAQVGKVMCLLTTAPLLLSCKAKRKQAQEGEDWDNSENSNVCFDNSWLHGHELAGSSLALKQ